MPTFDPSTPTITRKFAGHEFTVPAPFAEGSVLTGPEAAFLNGQIASVVGNAYSGDIRRAEEAKKGATKSWDHAAKFAEKYSGYVLGESNRGSGGTGSASSALDRMIRFLSGEDLKARIVRKGLKVAPFYKAAATDTTAYKNKWEELMAQNIEAKRDEFTATAEAQIAALAATDAEDDALFADVEVAAAAD